MIKKIVYLGSPDFSAYLLKKLNSLPLKINIVVTQKDKPVGRRKILTSTPVKKTALSLELPVKELEEWNEEIIRSLKDSDLAILYSFSKIIPKEILHLPKYGFLNVHPSLLPKFRGASPVVYPLALEKTKFGVSIIKITTKLDAGPIIFQAKTSISKEETKEDIYFKLTEIAFKGLKEILKLDFEKIALEPQDETKATYTRKLKKEDGFIPWIAIQEAIENKGKVNIQFLPRFLKEYLEKYPSERKGIRKKISFFSLHRALSPWPALWTIVKVAGKKKRLKILDISTKNEILKVQLEGKNPVHFNNFLKTAPLDMEFRGAKPRTESYSSKS